VKIMIDVPDGQVPYLLELAATPALCIDDPSLPATDEAVSTKIARVIKYLTSSAVDGVRRPGSWERQWLLQAFGDLP